MPKDKGRLGWHVIRADKRTFHGGLRVRLGGTLRHKGVAQLCVKGLHASPTAATALRCGAVVHDEGYLLGVAPWRDAILCRVLVRGVAEEHVGRFAKFVGKSRRCVAWWPLHQLGVRTLMTRFGDERAAGAKAEAAWAMQTAKRRLVARKAKRKPTKAKRRRK